MKLQKFKEKNHKKNLIIIIGIIVTLLLGFIYLYYSFAIFTDDKEFHVINGTVPDQKYDVMFSYYVNNKSVASIPTSKNYDVTISCNNGVTGSWDYSEWGPNLTNFSKSKTVCSVYYVTPTNIAAQITDKTKNYTYVNSLDKKKDLRYVGANPNNYLYFNCSDYNNQTSDTCELWRIIGVFKSIKKADGTTSDLVKIIRANVLDKLIPFDEKYVNDYSTSSLKTLLNESYLNGTYKSGAIKNDKTREAIESVVWKLGCAGSNKDTPANFFTYERGTNVYSGHATTWTGKVGLMYASDYGYASSYTTQLNGPAKVDCSSRNYSDWDSGCTDENWLYNETLASSGWGQWVLTPTCDANVQYYYTTSLSAYKLFSQSDATPQYVAPVVYLSNNINIASGSGTSSSPYKLLLKF